ncbi:MAG: non-canonical purine NTP pyrophosphatase [Gemmatimonadaceae bacterium]
MSVRRVLVATRNAGKVRELRPMLEAAGYTPLDLSAAGIGERPEEEEGVECHPTFEGNALAKARYFAARHPGVAVLADDSGLEVEALEGAPGVHSRRWAALAGEGGPDTDAANNARLLRQLVGASSRAASFVCAAAWVEDGRELVRRGEVAGEILPSSRGASGFGYDPYFLSHELGMSFGEATVEQKAGVSHRARAVAALLAAVADDGCEG